MNFRHLSFLSICIMLFSNVHVYSQSRIFKCKVEQFTDEHSSSDVFFNTLIDSACAEINRQNYSNALVVLSYAVHLDSLDHVPPNSYPNAFIIIQREKLKEYILSLSNNDSLLNSPAESKVIKKDSTSLIPTQNSKIVANEKVVKTSNSVKVNSKDKRKKGELKALNQMGREFKEGEINFVASFRLIRDFNEDLTFRLANYLEFKKDYQIASIYYEKLEKSKRYGDTIFLRAADCLSRLNQTVNLTKAIRFLDFYILSKNKNGDLATPYALKAYCFLKLDSLPQANLAISEGKRLNENNAKLQFVTACLKVKQKSNDKALAFIENAMASKQIALDEFLNEKLLFPLLKTEKFKKLAKKYFH